MTPACRLSADSSLWGWKRLSESFGNAIRSYTFGANGGLENGTAGWLLSGPARVADGNESFYVHNSADHSSLALPSGSSALTPKLWPQPFDFGNISKVFDTAPMFRYAENTFLYAFLATIGVVVSSVPVAYALACLVATACFYWPWVLLHDWMRARLPRLAGLVWPGDANSQTDV